MVMTFHHSGRQRGSVGKSHRADTVRQDVYDVILREIAQLRGDKPVLALLASSVDSNVGTCLQIMQHRLDLADVAAPVAAV
jgi:hypothetical protein